MCFVNVLLPFHSTVRIGSVGGTTMRETDRKTGIMRERKFSAHIMLMHFDDAATAAVNIIIFFLFPFLVGW